jgi:hypothetical protein
MARIVTMEQMRNYIKLMLGAPVINIEVTNAQLDQVIEDSVQQFHKYDYGTGQYLDYFIFTTSAGQTYYNMYEDPATSATWATVSNIVDLHISFGVNGINTLFSPTHILLMENGQANNVLGGSKLFTGNVTPGLEMTSYQIAMMYLTELKERLGKMYTVNWIPARGTLMITPTPRETVTGVLQLYRRETIENLYNDDLVKRLCLAKTKIVWGGILRKYSMTLPGGGTITGTEIREEGREEEREILELIRLESEQPSEVFIG